LDGCTSIVESRGEVPESGRTGLPAKEVLGVTLAVGSNPTLSAEPRPRCTRGRACFLPRAALLGAGRSYGLRFRDIGRVGQKNQSGLNRRPPRSDVRSTGMRDGHVAIERDAPRGDAEAGT